MATITPEGTSPNNKLIRVEVGAGETTSPIYVAGPASVACKPGAGGTMNVTGATSVQRATVSKLAVGYSGSTARMSHNASAVVSATAGSIPMGQTSLRIGDTGSAGTMPLRGRIRSVAYYASDSRTNTQLQALAT